MASLHELTDGPGLRSQLVRLAGPGDDVEVRHVALVESAEHVELPADAIVVFTENASRASIGYRLDMVLRVAAQRRVSAIVFTDGRDRIETTAATIAARSGVSVFSAHSGTDLGTLLLALHRGLAGGAEAALSSLEAALDALARAEMLDADGAALLEAVTEAFGQPFVLRAPIEGEISAPVVVRDQEDAVCTARVSGHSETAARAVAHLTAAAVSRARASQRRAEEIPVRSRSELLTEFLLVPPNRGDRLLDRMRAVDLTVDGWHVVVRVEVEDLDTRTDGDELASYTLADRISRTGLAAARASGGVWHAAQLGSALLLIRMERSDFGLRGARDTQRAASEIIRRTVARDDVSLVCGIGGVHSGATGLRTSAAEAQAAVAAARAAHRTNVPVSFDEVGLRRTLLEWFATDTARDAVDSILRPLDKLDPQRSKRAIETLQAYLDNQGSLARTAEQLHLHRNAVAYRIKRVFDVLEVDPDDADTRLLLQLACRARSLG